MGRKKVKSDKITSSQPKEREKDLKTLLLLYLMTLN